MSDITGGTEPPSRFMMGLEGAEDDTRFEKALTDAFGIDTNDASQGNPNKAVDEVDEVNETEGADGDGEEVEPGIEGGVPGDEPPVEPPAEPPVDDQAQVQGGGDEDDVATGVDASDFASLFETRYGRKPEPAEYEGLLALADWANSLTYEQQEAINRALSGQGQAPQEAAPPEPVPDPLTDELVSQYGEDDPLVKAYKVQQEQLAELRETYQRRYIQETQQDTIRQVELASEQFRSSREELTEADIDRLQGAVANAGVFPGFVQAAGGDIASAMNKALDWAYWQDEVCREREIARRAAANPTVQQAHKARQTKAASVTGTGGNGASRTEPPSKNADPWAQVAQGLREAQNNGVPG